ncbi:MAG TPA: cytochrome c [Acidiferrobacter sp.]|nr:cytochrome c [Acidiferrobacter sp.]
MHTIRIVIAVLLLQFAMIVAAGTLFVYLGVFNVSALWTDPAPVYGLLKAVRRNSIERRSVNIQVPKNMDLQDPKMIRAGFKIFIRSCMVCHGGPGLKQADLLREGLYPKPPKFSQAYNLQLNPQELFWVIKNGVRMTGMPSWKPSKDNTEIWELVAYLKNLPNDAKLVSAHKK